MIFDYKIELEQVKSILKYQLQFFFPEISEVNFTEENIVLESEHILNNEKISTQIERIIYSFSNLKNDIPKKILYDTRKDKNRNEKAADKLFLDKANEFLKKVRWSSGQNSEKGEKVIVKKGLNIYSGESTVFIDSLDILIKDYFTNKYNAKNLIVPSIISSNVVEKAGYFETGCQHISFVAPISNDPELFMGFNEFYKKGSHIISKDVYKYVKVPENILNPAMCLHCYPLYENRDLKNSYDVLTLMGSCFRDESGNLNNEERLKEFKMREIVYIGNGSFFKEIHKELIDFLITFGRFFDLDFKLEISNDIFFNENAEKQLFSQLISDNKIEFCVYIEELDRYVACASINKHGTHFSKPFNITGEGKYSSSMCIGFGLDRLYLALNSLINAKKGFLRD